MEGAAQRARPADRDAEDVRIIEEETKYNHGEV
jgi:hypothetical protein